MDKQTLCLWLFAMGCIGTCVSARAIEPFVEYRKHIEGAQTLTALNDQLMGDSVSLYNGATEFSATDISLPGNNALPVQLSRRFSVELHPTGVNGEADASLYGAGNWDVDVPYITATYISGSGWAANRCSAAAIPSAAGFDPTDYWHGNSIHVPGGGDRPMLLLQEAGIPRIADGAQHLWTTRERDMFTCIAMKSGLSGEGFRMLTTSGLRYYFDVAVSRYAGFMSFTPGEGMPSYSVSRTVYYLLASKIEDRFGNTVSFVYNADGHPTSITSSDGRAITLAYTSGRLASATTNGRTWQYGYGTGATAGMLTSVTQPDTSKWQYAYTGTLTPDAGPVWDGGSGPSCGIKPPPIPASFGLTVTHPSGAVGAFQFANTRHYRAGVHKSECLQRVSGGTYYYKLHTPNYFDVVSLQSKALSGPGLVPMNWSYNYGISNQGLWGSGGPAVYPCTTCPTEKTVTVTRPDSTKQQYRYGFLYALNEGKLLGSSTLDAGGIARRTETTTYLTEAEATGQNFFPRYGTVFGSTDPSVAAVRPVTRQTIQQDGATFTMQVNTGCSTSTVYCFDIYGNPTKVTRFSSLSSAYSRTEQTAYFNQTSQWILGQAASVTCLLPASCAGQVMSSTTYHATTAVPLTVSAFGKLKQTLTYNTDGTVATVKDGGGHATTLAGWKRGTPQTITWPATTDQPTAVSLKAVVDDNGWMTSITDENNYRTCYGYDAMGRINKVTYPSETASNVCDASTWAVTAGVFQQMPVAEYGIPASHWRQIVDTGRGRRVVYFDAFWRPLVEDTYDLDNVAGTRSITVKRYDNRSRLAFQSYPVSTVSNYATVTAGTSTAYDALDRVVTSSVPGTDSVTGPFVTTTEYLNGFQTRVTNPRGYKTTTSYLAWDQPTTDYPMAVTLPESVLVAFGRDAYGKPNSLTRKGSSGAPTSTRSYAYNTYQELCRTVEPETGATLMGYDAAGNLAWTAAGLASSTACDPSGTTSAVLTRKVSRGYDTRNRLKTLTFPDGDGNQTWTYTPDSLPASVVTTMLSDSHVVINLYAYNRRRLLAAESQQLTGWGTHTLNRQYDANGHLASLVYPAAYLGSVVDYAPNALGQPTKAGTFASAVTYYPNGAIKSFTYGNGIKHTLTQNLRGLPDTSCDFVTSCNVGAILNDSYDYDQNGNVKAISDGRTGNRGDRDMTYDALDRLTQAVSPMFGTATYAYDALDNLTRVKVTAGNQIRDHYYCYDARWQLTNVKTGSCTGTTVMGLGYDPQGNLANRSGVVYRFDYGNRLREVVGRENHFWYDGHGRRVGSNRLVNGSSVRRSVYSRDGQLLFAQDQGEGKRKEYIYLGGSLLAERALPNTGAATPVTIRYQHTDALGSPVAITNESKTIVEKTEYEPYGWAANRPQRNGPGYTGHHEDAATGMIYMQQRYYDPMIGRFLSVDPVSANRHRGSNFNRYWYANNNSYRFTDPDGRLAFDDEKDKPPPPPKPEEDKPEPVTLGTVSVTATRPAPAPVSAPIPWGRVGGFVGRRLVGPVALFWPSPIGVSPCETQGPFACGMMSELGDKAPSDAPPGTLPLDKAKGKFGLDKDTLHKVKDAATGGAGTGTTWVGVAPDSTVGTNEGGSWAPQGTVDELKP